MTCKVSCWCCLSPELIIRVMDCETQFFKFSSCIFSLRHFLCFQMMLKCKDKKWYQFWSAPGEEQSSADKAFTIHRLIRTHRDPALPHPSIHRSLRAFFTETLGIFFPSTMWNTVLTSVWRWNRGVDGGEGRPQRDPINGVFFYFMFSSLYPVGERTWRFFILICQKHPLTVFSTPPGASGGRDSNRRTQPRKDKAPSEETKTTKNS